MKKLLIAQDIGGSKAESVLFSENGEILHRVVEHGVNALDKGCQAAVECCTYGASAVTAGEKIRGIYCGIAGGHYYSSQLTDALQMLFPDAAVRATSDMPMLISAMLGHVDGAGMICGTGTSLCIRQGESISQVGGYGYSIDNRAGGYDLGRKAIYAALREKDGRGKRTLLTALLEERMGDKVEDFVPKLYEGGISFIASFAPVVFAARKAGDEVASDIFERGAAHLAEMATAAGNKLGGAYTLVLNGGIFAHFPEYVQAFANKIPKSVRLLQSDAPPILGAAVEAMWQCGIPCDEAWRIRFLEIYRKLYV